MSAGARFKSCTTHVRPRPPPPRRQLPAGPGEQEANVRGEGGTGTSTSIVLRTCSRFSPTRLRKACWAFADQIRRSSTGAGQEFRFAHGCDGPAAIPAHPRDPRGHSGAAAPTNGDVPSISYSGTTGVVRGGLDRPGAGRAGLVEPLIPIPESQRVVRLRVTSLGDATLAWLRGSAPRAAVRGFTTRSCSCRNATGAAQTCEAAVRVGGT